MKSLGKMVGAILPKEAESLTITAGNHGTEFVRNQLSTFARVYHVARDTSKTLELKT